MQTDIRETALYREVEALYGALRQPGTGQISDAADVDGSPDGRHAVFAATIVDKLEGVPPTRIALTEIATADTRVLTFGPNTDRLPKYSPDGRDVAFLSDRDRAADFKLHLLDPRSGAVRRTPPVPGWVEYLQWSPDGKRILLGVAGHGADVAGGQGAITSDRSATKLPSWMPNVETGDEGYRWRRAWMYDLAADRVQQVSAMDLNIWEACWCGNDAIAAVASSGPGEGLWYTARLHLIGLGGDSRELFAPQDQLGWPSGSPSGRYIAVVEAICSDRWIVAGNLRSIETASGTVRRIDTHGVDITHTEWRSDRHLLVAGHRGFESVIGLCDAASGAFKEVWSSDVRSAGARYIKAAGLNDAGDCLLVSESFVQAPELAVIRNAQYRTVKSFDLGYAEQAKVIAEVQSVTWPAPDGVQIQGWLLRPHGKGPHPLIVNIHGGPVWQWRPFWLSRGGLGFPMLMLLQRGYAIFFPNPRGSSGRGQDFVRHVLGEMGGADTYDYLSGVDHLVERGIADPARLGVTGGSYGGFMTSWLITQDPRFAAAVPVAPVTNQVTEHLISNIPHFVKLFLNDSYTNPTGKYFHRSPIMHAHKARTPTLNICGALDRATPPAEAMQFHNALLENGVKSVLVTYPHEGHGVRKLPTVLDYSARLILWFEEQIGAKGANDAGR